MLWRSSKPVSRKRPPSGFIIPSQATLATRAPSGPRWTHEIKFDGYRLVAHRRNGLVRLWSRHATDFTGTFTRIGEAVAALPGGDLIIDGEACIIRPDGRSDFDDLRSRHGAASAILVGFDLLHADDRDIRRQPLEERRARLQAMITGMAGLMYSEALKGDGEEIFRRACALGCEGIVSKLRGKPYSSGRCSPWLKTKNPAFARP